MVNVGHSTTLGVVFEWCSTVLPLYIDPA